MLTVDTKLICKLLAERHKKIAPPLISKNQTGYIKKRFVTEGGKLISHILDISDTLKIKGF